ncbi:Nuclease S1 [Mycena venus]|uniref:Nuclease S1 n=1 Tax=Mycena venus TaxID=2733690 RepID=A0A8H6YG13_9AGAR|nr:Nuclease S1 [Mycena venus]
MKTCAYIGVLSALSGVYGWGDPGHEAFLAPNALSFVQSSLTSAYNGSLGPAAPWADEVRKEAEYKWSAAYHFVDAEDNPPTSCSVNETRDCGDEACILSAIANYTTRVVDASLSALERQEALKFLDHFLGDITQPLHVEALEVGGNAITVTCNGSSTNLHLTWGTVPLFSCVLLLNVSFFQTDNGLIAMLLVANYSNSSMTWANSLAERIKANPTETELQSKRGITIAEDITNLLSRKDIESHATTSLKCPFTWAQDTNMLDCSYVFSFTNGTDLCNSSYYTSAIPIIETQIAKGGYRLAAWLNALFDNTTNLLSSDTEENLHREALGQYKLHQQNIDYYM